MCASGYIFQSKVDKIIPDIEIKKKDEILVLSKESLSKHIDRVSVIFVGLRDPGLKANSPKCSIRLKYILFLGYVITWYGIQPNLRKLHGIVDLVTPNTKTKLQELIGMLKYYKYMYPRRSHVLAPLTERRLLALNMEKYSD